MVGELVPRFFQARRIGVVEHDGVDFEFLCGDLQVIAACAGDHDPVARVAEALRDRAA